MDGQLTIVLADRRPLMREAFRVHFGRVSTIHLVAEVSTAEEAEAALLRVRPRLLILQSELLAGGHVEVLYRLKSWCPDTAIIMIGTSGLTTGELTEIADLHHRWLPDHVTADALIDAVLDAGRNGPHLPNGPADRAEGVIAPAEEEPLTPREGEILRLAAAGLSNRQIADRLVLSRYTVRNHIRNIFAKLKVKNRTAASAFVYARMFERALTATASVQYPPPSQAAASSKVFPRLRHLLQKRAS